MTRREASAEQGGLELPKVFINYRHDDAEEAAVRLYERLAAEFGDDNVFLDAKTLGVGTKWLEQIKAHGDRGGAFLALIGSQWLADLEQRKQLTARDPQDYVMLELELALHRWRGKVIPVLLGRTRMPAAVKLPKPIRALAALQATCLRALSFEEDVAELIEQIRAAPVEQQAPPDGETARERAVASATAGARHDRRQADDQGSPTEARSESAALAAPDEAHYALVVSKMVDQGSVVPVLGSGVCGALPDADQLAAHLSQQFRLGLDSPDLAEVAQRVAVSEGFSFLDKAMFEALSPGPEPQDVHRFLARFPARLREAGAAERYQMIVTMNYDSALEQAFDEQGEEYDLAVFLATGTDSAGTNKGKFLHVPWQDEPRVVSEPATYRDLGIDRFDDLERTLIVKVNGAAEGGEGDYRWDGNYVLTEDQYIDYLATDQIVRLVPNQILNKLTDSHCLFLGYALREWSLRVFLKRVWQGRPLANRSWAIERQPDAWECDCWKALNVEMHAASADDYANALDALMTRSRAASS
jgi:hypothetical protein